MKIFEVEDHAPSYLPEDSKWTLAWSDEFDGTALDRTKWNFRLHFWGERFDAYTDEGVVVKDGCVELHRTEKNGCYVSPQLQTGANSFDHLSAKRAANPWGQDGIWPFDEIPAPTFVHRYGYYECRCKFPKHPDLMWAAFWMQSPTIGARTEPEWAGIECDIMECFQTGMATTGTIMNGYGKQFTEEGRVRYALEETENGWHVFGMDWREDGYVFYCDGKEVSRCTEHVSHVPEFLLLTTEIQGYRSVKQGTYKLLSGGESEEPPFVIRGEFEDDAFIVDYVRVFDREKE